jgi:hypothetical protein
MREARFAELLVICLVAANIRQKGRKKKMQGRNHVSTTARKLDLSIAFRGPGP